MINNSTSTTHTYYTVFLMSDVQVNPILIHFYEIRVLESTCFRCDRVQSNAVLLICFHHNTKQCIAAAHPQEQSMELIRKLSDEGEG